jgi:hypothetical protein
VFDALEDEGVEISRAALVSQEGSTIETAGGGSIGSPFKDAF